MRQPTWLRRGVLVGVTAAVVVIAVIIAAGRTGQDSPVTTEPTPSIPAPTSSTTVPRIDPARLNAFPPAGAVPSTPEVGLLVPDLPLLPVWVYEDRRVIVALEVVYAPPQIDPSSGGYSGGSWMNFFERRLTPQGLELVRSEIRPGGKLDPATTPTKPWPPWGFFDGDRQLITTLEARHDLPWLPADAWEDPEFTLFVPSRYVACLGGPDPTDAADPAALLAQLPAEAASLLEEATPTEGNLEDWPGQACFDVPTDGARRVAVALDAVGAGQPQNGNPFSFGIRPPGKASPSVGVHFVPYLPHGNPVLCCAG